MLQAGRTAYTAAATAAEAAVPGEQAEEPGLEVRSYGTVAAKAARARRCTVPMVHLHLGSVWRFHRLEDRRGLGKSCWDCVV
jgi:hypothetical protein